MWMANKRWWSKIQYETKIQFSYLLTFYNDENRILIRIQNLKDFTEKGKKIKQLLNMNFWKYGNINYLSRSKAKMSSNLLRYLDSLAEQEQSLPSSPGRSSTVSTKVGETYYKAHPSSQLSRRTSISESSGSSSGSTTRNDDDTRRRINQEYIPRDNYDVSLN